MHPGIRITKVKASYHGAAIKNIRPEKMKRSEMSQGGDIFYWGNGRLTKPL